MTEHWAMPLQGHALEYRSLFNYPACIARTGSTVSKFWVGLNSPRQHLDIFLGEPYTAQRRLQQLSSIYQ